MSVNIWQLLAFVTAMNVLLLLGVFIGGWLVFRVRMNGEPMFINRNKDEGGAYNLDDLDEEAEPEIPEEMVKRSREVVDKLFGNKEDFNLGDK